jgi:hypothetical protein
VPVAKGDLDREHSLLVEPFSFALPGSLAATGIVTILIIVALRT